MEGSESGPTQREIPESGMIVPDMGKVGAPARSGIADALFTPVQGRVLGLLFGQPERRFQSAELIRLAHGGTGAVHRQLERLADSGLVTVTRAGNQKHYQAREDCPVFAELHGLVVKTVGLVEPIRRALAPFEPRIRAAFVFGSIAKRTETASSDIDLLILSETLAYSDLFDALQAAEAVLARSVNPTVFTIAEWHLRRAEADSFASRIASQPRIFVIGGDDDLH
jgi:predicted nucleotidyltransferase